MLTDDEIELMNILLANLLAWGRCYRVWVCGANDKPLPENVVSLREKGWIDIINHDDGWSKYYGVRLTEQGEMIARLVQPVSSF